MKKVYIKTYGCQMNVHESEKLYAAFASEGFDRTDVLDDADIVILNTCCIREGAETRVIGNLGLVKRLKDIKPNLIVAVCGCMSQQKSVAEYLHQRCPFINIITGTYSLRLLPNMVRQVENGEKYILDLTVDESVPDGINEAVVSDSVNSFVNITYGCNNFCTYCIVPYVKGRERSRRLKDVKNEVVSLVRMGVKEITLLGQNVNSYVDEDGNNFYALLNELASIDGDFWIKFMTSHPKDLSKDVVKLIGQTDRLANYIHLPVQSGSDEILKKMNRKYNVATYLEKVSWIKDSISDVGITSDIIVGFPTETDEDFEKTVSLVKQVEYNNLFTFEYSKRNGTPAASMEQVPEDVKSDRIRRLIDVQATIANDLAQKCVGKTYRVLCDGRGEKSTGKTYNDRVIVFDDRGRDLYNGFVDIKVTSANNSKLYGVIVEN